MNKAIETLQEGREELDFAARASENARGRLFVINGRTVRYFPNNTKARSHAEKTGGEAYLA